MYHISPSTFRGPFSTLNHLYLTCWRDRRVRVALFAYLLPDFCIPLLERHSPGPGWTIAHHAVLALLCLYAFPLCRQRWKVVGMNGWMGFHPKLRIPSQFSTQSFALGLVNGWAICQALGASGAPHTLAFCLYAFMFTLFHFSEFLVTGSPPLPLINCPIPLFSLCQP